MRKTCKFLEIAKAFDDVEQLFFLNAILNAQFTEY